MTRAGFIGFAGRPNAGKSTLVNAIVGARVAIVSERPQTTRRAVRGVATDEKAAWQLVLVDLPGVQRPRDALTQRMQRRVERELAGSDVALLVINGREGVGPGDRFIAKALLSANAEIPVIAAVNKIDLLSPGRIAEVLSATAELEVVDEIFPISAKGGDGLEPLIARLAELIPEGPFMYEPDQHSDQPSEVMLAELIREQVLMRTREELPHAVEVEVSEVETTDIEDGSSASRPGPPQLTKIRAHIWAETDSQKSILIGKNGRKIKEIGSGARAELERELDGKVFLDLKVRVRAHWRRDDALLDRLGIE